MIERGEKTEEYRERTDYWLIRLMSCNSLICKGRTCRSCSQLKFKDYDAVCFSYGYTKRRMMFECSGISIGRGRPEWGAPDYETFIIKLGNRL